MKCNYYDYIVYLYPTVKFQIVAFSLGTCHFPRSDDIELVFNIYYIIYIIFYK